MDCSVGVIGETGKSVLYGASRRLKPAAPCLVRYSNINKVGGKRELRIATFLLHAQFPSGPQRFHQLIVQRLAGGQKCDVLAFIPFWIDGKNGLSSRRRHAPARLGDQYRPRRDVPEFDFLGETGIPRPAGGQGQIQAS